MSAVRTRIDLVAPPMAGHLHPILGLARGLADAGYDARVASSAGAQAEIVAAGLRGHALLAGRDDEVRAIVEPAHPVGSHPWRLRRQLRANLALLADFRRALHDLWSQQGPPALVIADFTVPVTAVVARAFEVPWWTTHPSPCVIETADGPPAYLGGWRPGRGPLGRWRDAMGRLAVRTAKRTAYALYRPAMHRIGLEAIYRADGTEAVYSAARIFALGLAELEFPRQWPAAVEFVGPVLYTPPVDVAPPPFLDGRRHVLVTIGTHLPWMKEAMAAAAAEAARAMPDVEVHFTDGRLDFALTATPTARTATAPPNFRRLPYVSYARDLGRYDLVVHHGGTGVMYRTLAAGRPALVLPLDYDQFDHVARLEAAGAARRLHAASELAAVLPSALADEAMAARCHGWARRVAATDAVAAVTAAVTRVQRSATR